MNGGKSWEDLYKENPPDLFGNINIKREPGVDGAPNVYKDKLSNQFGNRFLQEFRTLKNSRNSPLFEFLFCAGNPSGAKIAKRIAEHMKL